MKKSILLVAVILTIIVTLPVIGNSFMKKMIDTRLVELKSHGLSTNNDTDKSDYLHTFRHFEFAVQDSPKFLKYLNTFSDKQIPPYVNAMLKGAIVGMDVEYNNLPFAKGLSIEIYPLTLSENIVKAIKDEDLTFYSYIDNFLRLKGILYHINYNVTSKSFDGYLKDIKESYTLKDGTNLELELKEALFSGSGYLVAPDRLSMKIKKIDFGVQNKMITFEFTLGKFKSLSSFESASTYLSSIDLNNMQFMLKDKNENLLLTSQDTKINFSANTQGKKAEFNTKSSIKELTFHTSKENISLKKFKYDIAVNGVDKTTLERLRVLATQRQTKHQVNAEIVKAGIDVISHGLEINISELSIKNITLNEKEDLKGFHIKSALKIKEDLELASKINLSPLLLVDDVDLDINIKLSNEIYNKIMQDIPMTSSISSYANVDDSDTVFDVTYANGALKINGKDLQ
ncbi:MAG: DUF945 family protein [Sulfurimonas sp.]